MSLFTRTMNSINSTGTFCLDISTYLQNKLLQSMSEFLFRQCSFLPEEGRPMQIPIYREYPQMISCYRSGSFTPLCLLLLYFFSLSSEDHCFDTLHALWWFKWFRIQQSTKVWWKFENWIWKHKSFKPLNDAATLVKCLKYLF